MPAPATMLPVEDVIRSADVIRTSAPSGPVINLYQGNGAFGGSYGPFGLHNPPSEPALSRFGKTQFLHLSHWIRGSYNNDYLVPMAQLHWQETPAEVQAYSQRQSLWDGTLLTQFRSRVASVAVETWFDPVDDSLAAVTVEVKDGSAPAIVFAPIVKPTLHYHQRPEQTAGITRDGEAWRIDLACGGRTTALHLRTTAEVAVSGTNLVLTLRPGRNEILLGVNQPVRVTAEASRTRTVAWWHETWNRTGLVLPPDANARQLWVRSLAQFHQTCGSRKLGLPPPTGFTDNCWPFSFPQDLSYIHPVLLAAGDLAVAKSWVEYFSERLPGMRAYTERLLRTPGVLCPWVMPYGDFDGFHTPAPPNKYYYEIHNSGYLARMAHETALFVNDPEWTRRHARPLIRETALFYRGISRKGDDGLWHLSIKPAMGQDEMGGENQDDYLCALFSAKYCFQKAIEHGLDDDGALATILKDGLAFAPLRSKRGFYFTSGGSGEQDFGRQKHPVQLNELAFLPTGRDVAEPSRIAYALRYEITHDATKPYFYGWTLGEFLLAGSRMGDTDGWTRDWNALLPSGYVDPDGVQVYETSFAWNTAFYTTTNGLLCQSLLANVVCDWFGTLEIARCYPWGAQPTQLKDIRSALGVTISGTVTASEARLHLVAWKDCEFKLHDRTITLAKGREQSVNLNLNTLK